MKLTNEYWVLTKEDALNYATTLQVSSECENDLNPDKPRYPYEYCLSHSKKQLKRNIQCNPTELKVLKMYSMIQKQKDRFYRDQMISNIFGTLENWYDHLGTIKLHKIFLKENSIMLNKVESQAELILKRINNA